MKKEKTYKHLVPNIPLCPPIPKPNDLDSILKIDYIITSMDNTTTKDSKNKDKNEAKEKNTVKNKRPRISIPSKYIKYKWIDKNSETLNIFYEAEDLYNHMMANCKAENERISKMKYSKKVAEKANLRIYNMMVSSFWTWLIGRCGKNYFLASIIYQYIEFKDKELYEDIIDWYKNEMVLGKNS